MNKVCKKILLFINVFILVFALSACTSNGKCSNGKHSDLEWVIVEDSTCYSLGSKNQVCKNCKDVLTTAIIDYKEHSIVIDQEVEATCLENGLSKGSHCSVCDTVIEQQIETSKLGHNYILDNNLSSENMLIYVCSNCKDSYEVMNSNNQCDGNHIESDWIVLFDSTCKDLGTEHKICTICEIELQIRSISLKDHVEKVIEGYKATCENDGLSDGIVCENCDKILKEQEVINKLNHDYNIINTVSPVDDKDGYIEYKCNNCNDTYKEIIKNNGDYDNEASTSIYFSDNGISVENNNGGVLVNGNQVVISLGGEYDFIGEISEGSVLISLDDSSDAIINLRGFKLSCSTTNPIFIENANSVDISAKVDTVNYIYDKRSVSSSDLVGGAIYSKADLDIKGKGSLYVYSTYNNGIASTKDLEIKNLQLEVNAPNNALKGNDSLTIESGTIKAISSTGDALKTENSDVSEKGNQRGIITILDGTIDLYAACDGIDASYDVVIEGGNINIYTETYSSFSGDVSVTNSSKIYLRISSRVSNLNSINKYSAQFINEDNSITWVNGTYLSSGNRKYYVFDVSNNAKYVKFYAYSSNQNLGQDTNYTYCSDQLTISNSYDTYYVNSLSSVRFSGSWENYSSPSTGGGKPGGMGGGMNEGNPNSSEYSCKGIKADNSISINGGIINIKSHDDAIHTNSDVLLANGSYGSANLTINGGTLNLYADDDGIHSDGILTINGGNIIISNSYEGIEGNYIYFKNGTVQIKSQDDGINAKTTLYFEGSDVYLDAGGDGLDSNGNIYMSAGVVLALGPTNGGNGVIDYGDRNCTFSFTGGLLLAIGCSGMNAKPTGTTGNTVSATSISASVNSYLTISSNGKIVAVLKVTKSNQNYQVFAYNNSDYPQANVSIQSSYSGTLVNGLYYINK